jgi:hypothetical protein
MRLPVVDIGSSLVRRWKRTAAGWCKFASLRGSTRTRYSLKALAKDASKNVFVQCSTRRRKASDKLCMTATKKLFFPWKSFGACEN